MDPPRVKTVFFSGFRTRKYPNLKSSDGSSFGVCFDTHASRFQLCDNYAGASIESKIKTRVFHTTADCVAFKLTVFLFKLVLIGPPCHRVRFACRFSPTRNRWRSVEPYVQRSPCHSKLLVFLTNSSPSRLSSTAGSPDVRLVSFRQISKLTPVQRK